MSNSLTEQSLPDESGASERTASNVGDGGEHPEPEGGPHLESPDSGSEALSHERDSKQLSQGTTSIDVEIFGSVYHVRGEQESKYLRQLAALVDGKMREISRHVPVVDSGKIAILAALNLADELLQCNNQQEGERVVMMEKVEQLTGLLTEALDT